jgi:hypothetical protein
MGWAFVGTDYYGREAGYGIQATCDKRGCNEVIDRGLGYICGDMHHGPFDMEPGCGRFYCEDHRGWVGDRGGCRHRGKKAWSRTKCQLLRRDGHWPEDDDVYYCACREWELGGPTGFLWDPRKGEDPVLENPRLLTDFIEHIEKRGFYSELPEKAA